MNKSSVNIGITEDEKELQKTAYAVVFHHMNFLNRILQLPEEHHWRPVMLLLKWNRRWNVGKTMLQGKLKMLPLLLGLEGGRISEVLRCLENLLEEGKSKTEQRLLSCPHMQGWSGPLRWICCLARDLTLTAGPIMWAAGWPALVLPFTLGLAKMNTLPYTRKQGHMALILALNMWASLFLCYEHQENRQKLVLEEKVEFSTFNFLFQFLSENVKFVWSKNIKTV